MNTLIASYDWITIQNEHNGGLSMAAILRKFNLNRYRLNKAIELNIFKPVKHKYIMSQELKLVLSNKRKAFLKDNSDRHPWRKSSKDISVPCEIFKSRLREHKVSFIEEYIPLADRNFSLDIALPDKMLAIEINGQQHYNNDGTLKDYYQSRHELIAAQGWTVIEIHHSLVWNDLIFTNVLKRIAESSHVIDFDFQGYAAQKMGQSVVNICVTCGVQINVYANQCRKCYSPSAARILPRTNMPLITKTCANCHTEYQVNKGHKDKKICSDLCRIEHSRKVIITREELHKLIWDMPMTIIAKNFNVSDKCIGKLVTKYKLEKPGRTFWAKYRANKLEGMSCPLL